VNELKKITEKWKTVYNCAG